MFEFGGKLIASHTAPLFRFFHFCYMLLITIGTEIEEKLFCNAIGLKNIRTDSTVPTYSISLIAHFHSVQRIEKVADLHAGSPGRVQTEGDRIRKEKVTDSKNTRMCEWCPEANNLSFVENVNVKNKSPCKNSSGGILGSESFLGMCRVPLRTTTPL